MTQMWESMGEKEVLRIGERLRVSLEHVRLPDGREIEDFLQFSTPSFAVIVAYTPDGKLICERQYKHGSREVILTLPAGTIEAGEDPLAAANRELLEETGYAGDDWQPLGHRVMHANAGGGLTFAFVARNCRRVAEPNSGDLEEMTIELKTPQEMLTTIISGELALVSDVAALLQGLLALGLLIPVQSNPPLDASR